MPNVIMNWLNAVIPPRSRAGEGSEMYIGATNDAVPIAIPGTNRAAHSVSTVGANVVHFRLSRSASLPDRNAPAIAPSSSDPTTHDSPNEPMPSDLAIYGSAPPITPVS